MQVLLFVYKCLYHSQDMPNIFSTYFSRRCSIHSYNTRSNSDLNVPLAHSNSGQRSIIFRGSQFWNRLPEELKSCTSITMFKKKVKHLLLSRL